MYGELKKMLGKLLKKLCEYKEVSIVEGSVSVAHVNLCVKIPPKLSVSEFMSYLNGKSALMIFDRQNINKKEAGTFGQKDTMQIQWAEMKKK